MLWLVSLNYQPMLAIELRRFEAQHVRLLLERACFCE